MSRVFHGTIDEESLEIYIGWVLGRRVWSAHDPLQGRRKLNGVLRGEYALEGTRMNQARLRARVRTALAHDSGAAQA